MFRGHDVVELGIVPRLLEKVLYRPVLFWDLPLCTIWHNWHRFVLIFSQVEGSLCSQRIVFFGSAFWLLMPSCKIVPYCAMSCWELQRCRIWSKFLATHFDALMTVLRVTMMMERSYFLQHSILFRRTLCTVQCHASGFACSATCAMLKCIVWEPNN